MLPPRPAMTVVHAMHPTLSPLRARYLVATPVGAAVEHRRLAVILHRPPWLRPGLRIGRRRRTRRWRSGSALCHLRPPGLRPLASGRGGGMRQGRPAPGLGQCQAGRAHGQLLDHSQIEIRLAALQRRRNSGLEIDLHHHGDHQRARPWRRQRPERPGSAIPPSSTQASPARATPRISH